MMNDQYFPFEANMRNNDEICHLLSEMGMEGYGIYLWLLSDLRIRDNYACSMKSLWSIAQAMAIEQEKVKHVIYDFSLFSIERVGEYDVFTSPYMDRVMQKLEENRRKRSEAGRKGAAVKREKVSNAEAMLSIASAEEKSKEKKSKEEKIKVTSSSEEVITERLWTDYINEAVEEQSWIEIQAMTSGFGLNFYKYQSIIIKAFINHVRAQGTENNIISLRTAKSYFTNFIRRGTVTNNRVSELLDKEIKKQKEKNPYRYETVDPITFARSYYGIPIPSEAPPRPSENSVWSDEAFMWS